MNQEWSGDLVGVARGASKEVRALLAEVGKTGKWVGRRDGRHIKLRCRSGVGVAIVALTPSDHRALMNIKADIKRAEKL